MHAPHRSILGSLLFDLRHRGHGRTGRRRGASIAGGLLPSALWQTRPHAIATTVPGQPGSGRGESPSSQLASGSVARYQTATGDPTAYFSRSPRRSVVSSRQLPAVSRIPVVRDDAMVVAAAALAQLDHVARRQDALGREQPDVSFRHVGALLKLAAAPAADDDRAAAMISIMPPEVLTRTRRGVGLRSAAGMPALSIALLPRTGSLLMRRDPIRADVPRPAARNGADTRSVR